MKLLVFIALVMITPVIFSCRNRSAKEKSDGMGTPADTGSNEMYVIENDEDDKFIREAGSSGKMEEELGRYAEQKALNPRVKNFGAMMAEDHSNANADLKGIAERRKIKLQMDEKHSKTLGGLQSENQSDFDKDYIKEMVNDHEEELKIFKKQVSDSKDPDVRAFASKNVPVLQLHLDSAKKIRDYLK
jgi:putative membrane protein